MLLAMKLTMCRRLAAVIRQPWSHGPSNLLKFMRAFGLPGREPDATMSRLFKVHLHGEIKSMLESPTLNTVDDCIVAINDK